MLTIFGCLEEHDEICRIVAFSLKAEFVGGGFCMQLLPIMDTYNILLKI